MSKPLQCATIWQQCWVWLRAIIDLGRARRRESFSTGDLRELTGAHSNLLVRIQAFIAMAQAQSPVRGLIFCKPCGMTKKKRKRKDPLRDLETPKGCVLLGQSCGFYFEVNFD